LTGEGHPYSLIANQKRGEKGARGNEAVRSEEGGNPKKKGIDAKRKKTARKPRRPALQLLKPRVR